MKEVINYQFCALCLVCPRSAFNWNRQNCNRQTIQRVKTLGHLGLVCVQMLGHKCHFPKSHFYILIIRNKKGPQALTTKAATAFPEVV